jgi:hypothetical protein
MGDDEGTDLATGVGNELEAATADLLGPELNAYASGYSDAVNVPDSPTQTAPGTQDFYAAGYGEAIADDIAAAAQNAEIRDQEMPEVRPYSPEQAAADAQAEAEREAEIRRVFGPKTGIGRARPRPRGPDELPEDTEEQEPVEEAE